MISAWNVGLGPSNFLATGERLAYQPERIDCELRLFLETALSAVPPPKPRCQDQVLQCLSRNLQVVHQDRYLHRLGHIQCSAAGGPDDATLSQ